MNDVVLDFRLGLPVGHRLGIQASQGNEPLEPNGVPLRLGALPKLKTLPGGRVTVHRLPE